MWLEESGGTDLTGGPSGLRAAWPHSTRGGAHHPNTMAGISCLTNVTPVGMRCPGVREWLSCLTSDDLGGGGQGEAPRSGEGHAYKETDYEDHHLYGCARGDLGTPRAGGQA